MTSEKVNGSERQEDRPIPNEIASDEKIMNAQGTGKNREMTEKSVRRKVAMFEVIGTTDSERYHYSREKVHKELGNFKIESIRRNFYHKPPEMPLHSLEKLPPLRKISDSFLVQNTTILHPCLAGDEKSVSNEEIPKAISSETGTCDVYSNNMLHQAQNDENSVSQTTLTSSTGAIEESTETHYLTKQKSEEEESELEVELFEFDLTIAPFNIDDTSLEIPKEKMSTTFEETRYSIRDERTIQIGDCNVAMMTNASSSTDGTYISIPVQVRSQLLAQNRDSDTSSGDYKCAVPPSFEPIYDRALTDQESSSSSTSAVLLRPTIVKILQKHNEKIKRPSSWHLGISESEHRPGKCVRRQRRHSLSVCSTKSSISDQNRDANSQPTIPSASSTNDSWSGSDFNNELNFSTTSDSSRSHIYDADDDESDQYDRPHQYSSENPYDTPSPSRPRSETTKTITHVCDPDSIDEIPEHFDAEGTEIVQQISPVMTASESPKPPPIPTRILKEYDSSFSDESSEGKTAATHSSGNPKSSLHNLFEERLKQRHLPHTYTSQLSYNLPKGNQRPRKFSLNQTSTSSPSEQSERDPKLPSKYKRMLFPFKRSTSVILTSRQIDDIVATADFESSTSFEDFQIEPCTSEKSNKGIRKKIMRLMKGSKKKEKSE